jgi:hypothetical protein
MTWTLGSGTKETHNIGCKKRRLALQALKRARWI